MSSFASFIVSRAFWKNLFISIIVAFILMWVGLKLTNLYTHHGEKIPVPDLRGKQLAEVEELINDSNLRYEVQDSVFNRGSEPGSVIEQYPRSGQEVKRKRLVTLTIAAIAPQKVQIDQVRDLSLRQAIGQLSKKGIYIKKLDYVPSSYTNLVTGISLNGKELRKGDKIYKGEEVTLIVGTNEGVTFTVPNLKGLSENYAKRKAFEAGLNIGKVTFKDDSEEGRRIARVQHQSLNSGDLATPGSSINLILAKPETTNEN
ncbi:beta-lactam-binding protein with PASTA domain [Balneicella halophila]|uniref:Beta-lactam-binding protein with PASTA domain n=1 Tax=Balneicella halophila TaxID=1537566 RepID=A0A7L4UTH7_BALHA|nr:PASTA domain-containing protein [Balneicella halophila]PVX52474.1 beta-lactam-binding protein with PASTA domain [Balneicella halophila]